MKVILTGATGYVGEGVLLELLRTPEVEKVLFYPLMYVLGGANNMTEMAHSMLACSRDGYSKFAIGANDIKKLAKKW